MPDIRPSTAVSQHVLLRQLLSDGSVRRSAHLLAAGVRAQALADAARAGIVVRAAPGAYHLPVDGKPSTRLAIAIACVRSPRATVCLLSAAYLCGLVDEHPSMTWLALPVGAHAPKQGDLPEQILRWSYAGAFEEGVVTDEVCSVPLRRTDTLRTIVDLLRYARYLGGEDAGLQAGARYVRQGGNPTLVLEVAERLATPASTMRRLTSAVQEWQAAAI
jgi:predicted transcriptional regulator of viral defense system